MSMESVLQAILRATCPRVWAGVYNPATPIVTPYIVWQGIGGESIRYGDNSPLSKRDTLVQVSVWAATRSEALAIIRNAEDLLCAAPEFQCKPEGEPVGTYEEDTKLHGSIQRFSIFADR